MITLEAPPNPQFWQALEAYIQGRIMEQVVEVEPRKVYFYRTDWAWGTDKEQARALCDERNQKMGIDRREAAKIQFQTMF